MCDYTLAYCYEGTRTCVPSVFLHSVLKRLAIFQVQNELGYLGSC